MKIPPSWKEARRYLLIEFDGEEKKAKQAIKKNLLFFLGAVNYAKTRPFFININSKIKNSKIKNKEKGKLIKTKFLVLSIHRKFLSQVRGSLLFCKPKTRCVYVSGTLKKLKKILFSKLKLVQFKKQ